MIPPDLFRTYSHIVLNISRCNIDRRPYLSPYMRTLAWNYNRTPLSSYLSAVRLYDMLLTQAVGLRGQSDRQCIKYAFLNSEPKYEYNTVQGIYSTHSGRQKNRPYSSLLLGTRKQWRGSPHALNPVASRSDVTRLHTDESTLY